MPRCLFAGAYLFIKSPIFAIQNFIMQQEVFTDILPSGVSFDIVRMKGYHQEWLTSGGTKGVGARSLEDVLADRIKRLGDCKEITPEIVKKMPSADFAYALLVMRFFTCDPYFKARRDQYADWLEKKSNIEAERKAAADDNLGVEIPVQPWEAEFKSDLPEHKFKFKYEWKSGNAKKSQDMVLPIYFHDFTVRKYGFQVENYTDPTAEKKDNMLGDKHYHFITLELSKMKVRWQILNVLTEHRFAHLFKDDTKVNSSSPITMRVPCEMQKASKSEMPIAIKKLGDLELLDLEQIRQNIYDVEGTSIQILL